MRGVGFAGSREVVRELVPKELKKLPNELSSAVICARRDSPSSSVGPVVWAGGELNSDLFISDGGLKREEEEAGGVLKDEFEGELGGRGLEEEAGGG